MGRVIARDGYLGIYLNDHRALMAAGVAVARRCQRSNRDSALGLTLAELVGELIRDKRLLESVMAARGVRRSRLKSSAVVVGERFGKLKLNGSLVGYSPLSRLVELDGLRVVILAKRGMWEALLAVEGLAPDPEEVRAAVGRADGQVERVEEARRAAAAEALSIRADPEGAG